MNSKLPIGSLRSPKAIPKEHRLRFSDVANVPCIKMFNGAMFVVLKVELECSTCCLRFSGEARETIKKLGTASEEERKNIGSVLMESATAEAYRIAGAMPCRLEESV